MTVFKIILIVIAGISLLVLAYLRGQIDARKEMIKDMDELIRKLTEEQK